MQSVRQTRCSRTETWLHGSPKRADPLRLCGTLQYAWHPTNVRSKPSNVSLLAKKKTKATRNLKRRSYRLSPRMSWKPMNCGHLSMNDGTNAGCGRSCAAALAKLWRLSSQIAARQAVASCGSRFHKPTKVAKAIAISGKPISSSFRKRRMNVLAKAAGRQITWNVGSTP